ncbi:MAG TPA: ribokinase, partial [Thermomicrobiales bacterium]|nr:ribokinase [Thermomicrobiales bacterium]
ISLGSINIDFQMRTDRWPEAGETLLAGNFLMTTGGKAANVAVLGRRLGGEVTLIGHVGNDPLADVVLDQLGEDGIGLAHVTRLPETPTAVSTIFVRPDGNKTIILASNANLAWDEERDAETVREVIASAPDGSVLVTDLEIPIGIVRCAMEAAHDRSFPVVLDPSPADQFADTLGVLTSVLVPSTSEAGTLTGVAVDSLNAAERAGRALVDRGTPVVCQKLLNGGCLVVTRASSEYIPSIPVDVVDKTGAGDAFASGMGVGLLEGKAVAAAATMGVAASSLAVTAYGSRESYPSRKRLDEMARRVTEAREERTRQT